MRKNTLRVIAPLLFFVQTKAMITLLRSLLILSAVFLFCPNFSIAQTGTVRVTKTVNGSAPSGSQSFTFQLRIGASATNNGTVLESQTANAGNGGLISFATNLIAGQTYQLCEIVAPGWTTNLGSFIPGTFTPPDGIAGDPQTDNSIIAGDFTVNPGETKTFEVDNTPPQTNCGWQQGDMTTYSQAYWGDAASEAADLLFQNFLSQYGSSLVIGGPATITFTTAGAVFTFLPQLATPGILPGNFQDPLSSPAGEFAGQVLALQLNVDFADANLIGGTTKLGDLIIHDFTLLPAVNGQSVRQFLATANTILGGGSASFGPSEAVAVARHINSAFLSGTPSQFAQNHLKKGWVQGDFETYSQIDWGDVQSEAAALLSPNFLLYYGGTGFVVGDFNTITFTTASAVFNFLPATGIAGTISFDQLDPLSTSAGELAGQVAALKLNVDFSDAGFITGTQSFAFGDLIINNLPSPLTVANGMTVRDFLDLANQILGGTSNLIGPTTTASIASILNNAFIDGVPSLNAQQYLFPPCIICPPIEEAGVTTYTQTEWGDGTSAAFVLLNTNFGSLYPTDFTIGTPNSIHLTDPSAFLSYLPASGQADVLIGTVFDPITTSSGELGGEVTALKLNVDFSDLNLLPGTPLGDLIFHDIATVPALNGMSVRQFLAMANLILGGNNPPAPISPGQAAATARFVNQAFLNGTPSQFAIDHLMIPCGPAPTNHCPTADDASVIIPVGNTTNIPLQASDEDDDPLTYAISQQPLHGTVSVSGNTATYTPNAGYYGADEFKFTADDGNCDDEGTVSISIIVCPKGKGFWRNNSDAWPAGSTPMMLGAVSYTQAELINLLNMSPGNGGGADASLLLAHQLIAAKLNIANGVVAGSVASTITHADGLLALYAGSLPYNVKVNSPAGQTMMTDAGVLENFNNGNTTTGCTVPVPQVNSQLTIMNEIQTVNDLGVKVYPNPGVNSFSLRVQGNSQEKMMMQVIDMYGRVIETRNVNANTITRFGDRYRAGTYFVRVIQGKEHKEIKLVKLSD